MYCTEVDMKVIRREYLIDQLFFSNWKGKGKFQKKSQLRLCEGSKSAQPRKLGLAVNNDVTSPTPILLSLKVFAFVSQGYLFVTLIQFNPIVFTKKRFFCRENKNAIEKYAVADDEWIIECRKNEAKSFLCKQPNIVGSHHCCSQVQFRVCGIVLSLFVVVPNALMSYETSHAVGWITVM